MGQVWGVSTSACCVADFVALVLLVGIVAAEFFAGLMDGVMVV